MSFIGYRTLKTGIGASVAMIVAKKLGLEYAVAAGIITILSIQSTKKRSVNFALVRIGACLIALLVAFLLFNIFGYYEVVFGAFLLVFIPLAVRFGLEEGIVVSSVLVTHLLVEKSVEISWLLNELFLMLIGVGIALLLNLYMPNIEKDIKEDQVYIEEKMKEILLHMAVGLKEHYVSIREEELFSNLNSRLKLSRGRVYKNLNNYYILDTSYYVDYIEMRIQQFETIKRMREHFKLFFMTYEQTIMIAKFTEQIAYSIHEHNTCDDLLQELQLLRGDFRNMSLPSTREEFENRAMLYQFLNDIEQFLKVKNELK